MAFLVTQTVKNPPVMQETRLQSLGWEDPLEKEMAPLQYSCLENPMDRGSWQATVHGVTKSDMTEWLSTHARSDLPLPHLQEHCGQGFTSECTISLVSPLICVHPTLLSLRAAFDTFPRSEKGFSVSIIPPCANTQIRAGQLSTHRTEFGGWWWALGPSRWGSASGPKSEVHWEQAPEHQCLWVPRKC